MKVSNIGRKLKTAPDFKESEFFTKSPNFKGNVQEVNGVIVNVDREVDQKTLSHQIDGILVKAFQTIREFYNVPITVTSSWRDEKYNSDVGGSKNSYHIKTLACDGKFTKNPEIQKKYNQDILSKGELYTKLRNLGINGFGLYPNFFHIDVRTENMSEKDEIGDLEIWDKTDIVQNLKDYALNKGEDNGSMIANFLGFKLKREYMIGIILLLLWRVFR